MTAIWKEVEVAVTHTRTHTHTNTNAGRNADRRKKKGLKPNNKNDKITYHLEKEENLRILSNVLQLAKK